MQINLHHKRALVCGGSQGIGKAIAIELAHLGASVTLLSRNEVSLEEVKAQLHHTPDQVHEIIIADMSNPEALKGIIKSYVEKQDVHILINNTGGPKAGPANEANTEDFIAAFNQHLVCNQIMVQACLKGMKESGYGRIINIISTSVKVPLHNLGVSNTIRGAVANWSKTLANELGRYGITVNNVLPGATKTERLEGIISNKAAASGKSKEEIEAEMLKEIPMGRFGEANEVANAVAFLASPAAAYINGINIPVDGGRTGSL